MFWFGDGADRFGGGLGKEYLFVIFRRAFLVVLFKKALGLWNESRMIAIQNKGTTATVYISQKSRSDSSQ
jgi:hypothetical protein